MAGTPEDVAEALGSEAAYKGTMAGHSGAVALGAMETVAGTKAMAGAAAGGSASTVAFFIPGGQAVTAVGVPTAVAVGASGALATTHGVYSMSKAMKGMERLKSRKGRIIKESGGDSAPKPRKRTESGAEPTVEPAVQDPPSGPKPERGTAQGDAWRYRRYRSEGGTKSYAEWKKVSRGGRPGSPDHVADVAANNAQATGDLRPMKIGDRVPDGVGRRGQAVEVRGQRVDPGPDGRVVVESERFGKRGQMVGEGRDQVRAIREADPNATVVVTDPANPNSPPVVYPPGTQPPTGRRLPSNSPTHQPAQPKNQ